MGIFISIIVMALTVSEYISFVIVFFNRKINKRASMKLLGLAFSASIIILSGFCDEYDYFVPLQIVTTFIVIFCLFDISISETLKIWLISFPMLMMLEYVPYMFYSPGNHMNIYSDLISISIIIAIQWLYYFIKRKSTCKDHSNEMFILKGRFWIFISIELFVLLFLVLVFTYDQVQKPDRNETKLIIVVTSIICIVILNLLMFRNYNAQRAYKIENEYLDQMNIQQREYFELLISKEEETKRFRHDINNELVQLKALVESRKTDKVNEFISEMLSEVNIIRRKNYTVGNETVDVMLNHFLFPVKDICNIEVNGVLGEELGVSQRDLCVVISNLLKNAVEEIQKGRGKEKYIKVLSYRGKNNIVFRVENTLFHQINTDETGIPGSTKPDKKNHGIGLKNVKSTVEKNDGFLKIYISRENFITEAVMKLNKK